MQVALDSASLGESRLGDALAGRSDLLQLGPHRRLEALVLQRQAGRLTHGLDERRVVEEQGVVDQRADRLGVRSQPRDRPLAAGGRQGTGDPFAVDVLAPFPVEELHRGVVERLCERVAQPGRRGGGTQLDDEAADRGAIQPRAEQAGKQSGGQGEEGQLNHPRGNLLVQRAPGDNARQGSQGDDERAGQDRRERAPPGRRRATPAPDERDHGHAHDDR